MAELTPLEIAQGANQELKKRLANFQTLTQTLIEDRIRDAAHKIGKLKPGAERDLLARGRNTFRVLEDASAIEPRDANDNLIYGKDVKPISIDEWVGKLKVTDAPHFWEPEGQGPGRDVSDLQTRLEEAEKNRDVESSIGLKRLIAKQRAAK